MYRSRNVRGLLQGLAGALFFSNIVFTAPATEALGSALSSDRLVVIGFVGGHIAHTDTIHQEVRFAAHLREQFPSVLGVEVFENSRGYQAHQRLLQLLDSDRDGVLSEYEKSSARIVLYGHSWGASEAINLARSLQKDGIPVLLTIQIDSVPKIGQNDRWIPANVAQAVNFYQRDGLLHGRRRILAEDRARTQILGNIRLSYKSHKVSCAGYPWFARLFMKPHIQIESDPRVWNQVESLIQSKLVAATPEPVQVVPEVEGTKP